MYRRLSLNRPSAASQRRGLGSALAARGEAPYRGIVNRDPLVGGLANLGAALMNGPRDRAAASQTAFDQEEKHNQLLNSIQFQKDRAAAVDRHNADQLKQQGENARMTHQDRERETRHKYETDVRNDENHAATASENARHHKAMEETAAKNAAKTTGSKAPDAGALTLDLWNKTRVAATKNEVQNGVPVRVYDPIAHQQLYNQGRDLIGRPDIAEWKTADTAIKGQGGAARIEQDNAAAAARGPLPTGASTSPMSMRRSGQPGVHTAGDLLGGVVDGWSGESAPPDAAAPAPAPASPNLFDGGAPAQPPAQNNVGLFGDAGAPAGQPPAKDNHPLDAVLMKLHPEDKLAFARVLATGDKTKIAEAERRLQSLAGHQPVAPSPTMPPTGRSVGPDESETSNAGLFDAGDEASE